MIARTALLGPLVLAAVALPATPSARAQCRLCAEPTTVPEGRNEDRPAQLEVQANLDFDRIIVLGSGEGTATLRPDGTHYATGSVEAISGRAMVGEARVRGEPGRTVRIEMPSRIQLYAVNGASISIDEIVTDLPAITQLDPAGVLSFRFGGRLRISGSSDGDYRGEVPITVEYLWQGPFRTKVFPLR